MNAIINPKKGKNFPNIGNLAFIISSDSDLRLASKSFKLADKKKRNFFMSKLYYDDRVSIVSNFIGAPYATILLENLIVCGVKKLFFFGTCGAIDKNFKIGDIIIPDSATIGEGVSRYYIEHKRSYPNPSLKQKIETHFKNENLKFKNGDIFTTSAFYREKREKIYELQKRRIVALEMELSALFTVATFRNVEITAILLVSDELYHEKWNDGSCNPDFKMQKREVLRAVGDFLL